MKATRIFVIRITILVGVILLLWIIGVYHKQGAQNLINSNPTTNTSVIEPSARSGIEIKAEDVGINAPVPFKVGNEYVYETVPVVTPEGKREFTREIVKVVGEERIEFDKNTGRCISKIMNSLNFSNSDLIATHSSMFAYWMLGLRDNLRFNIDLRF